MISHKLKDLDQLAQEIQLRKSSKQVVVHCHGCFDLVHLGHLYHFRSAKALGDLLVVTVTQDQFIHKGPGRPLFTQEQRRDYLSAITFIDYVAINRWPTAIETIVLLKPNIYVKGIEYQNADHDKTGNIAREIEAIESVGGKICFTDDPVWSSTQVLMKLRIE